MAAYGERNDGSGEDRDKDRHQRDRYCDRSDRRKRGIEEDEDDRSRYFESRSNDDRVMVYLKRRRCRRSSSPSEEKIGESMRTSPIVALEAAREPLSRAMARARARGLFQEMRDMLQKVEDALLSSDKFPFTVPDNGQPRGALSFMPVQAMTQQATRQARRVYVGGISPTATEQSVATFFNQAMAAIGGNIAVPGDAVVKVYTNHEKKLAFVEMRSVEEASNAMALDGISFEGAQVRVRRPSDYNPLLAAALGPSEPNPNLNLVAVGLMPGCPYAGGLEGLDRIFVGGLSNFFTEARIRELLESFGPLRCFDLVKDRETGNSKGYAFCIYQDVSVTDIACGALNGIKLGDKTLTARRAYQGASQPKPDGIKIGDEILTVRRAYQSASQPKPEPEQENVLFRHAQQQITTKVVCLRPRVVSPDELKDDEEYENIVDDMTEEGGKFGTLVNVVIPRPNRNGEPSPGIGKVFLEYADIEGSSKARTNLNGRKFDGNSVVAVFYPENKFSQGVYE